MENSNNNQDCCIVLYNAETKKKQSELEENY